MPRTHWSEAGPSCNDTDFERSWVLILNALNLSRISLFVALSIPLIWISRRSLRNYCSHGFYRFFVFEGIVVLLLLNSPYWFDNPLSFRQMASVVLLCFSAIFVYSGLRELKRSGGRRHAEMTPENFPFENTGRLVTIGLFRRIRHPMYSSLLLLAWGLFLKHISMVSAVLVVVTTIFVIIAAKVEEKENIYVFGSDYKAYIRTTKCFIPYLW